MFVVVNSKCRDEIMMDAGGSMQPTQPSTSHEAALRAMSQRMH